MNTFEMKLLDLTCYSLMMVSILQALLNLGSSDPSLRSAAYNLLCALTQTFDLKIEGQLLETNGRIHFYSLGRQWIHEVSTSFED